MQITIRDKDKPFAISLVLMLNSISHEIMETNYAPFTNE